MIAASLVVTAALAGGAVATSPASAAASTCYEHSGGSRSCITALAVSAPVESATGGTVTVTVTMTNTEWPLDLGYVGYSLPGGYVSADLEPVPDRPDTFSGRLEVPAGSAVGSFAATTLTGYVRSPTAEYFAIEQPTLVAGGTPGTLTITGTPDDSPPVLRSLSVSATTLDTTMGAASFEVEARITDGLAGVGRAHVATFYERAPDAHPGSWPAGWGTGTAGALELVSGTVNDGVWRGSVPVLEGSRGNWRLYVVPEDRWENRSEYEPDELAAAGMPSAVASTTSAPPAKPAVTGRTWIHTECCFPVVVDAVVTWTKPAGTPAISGILIESASAACGTPPRDWIPPNHGQFVFRNRNAFALCTVTLRTVNAAGASPPASVTFW